MLCLCLVVSSATSNIALAYINYPTKVVFRSCKLIPTMLIAVVYNRKRVPWFEFMFGGFISMGMVFFAAADFHVYPNFNFIGKLLLAAHFIVLSWGGSARPPLWSVLLS
jgi:adenosine 3'-phospho 5'-phosphosulfate transporter B3